MSDFTFDQGLYCIRVTDNEIEVFCDQEQMEFVNISPSNIEDLRKGLWEAVTTGGYKDFYKIQAVAVSATQCILVRWVAEGEVCLTFITDDTTWNITIPKAEASKFADSLTV